MNALVEIAPECPKCRVHHTQSFTPEDLSELLKYDAIALYCPRLDKSWRATREQRARLAHMVASFARF